MGGRGGSGETAAENEKDEVEDGLANVDPWPIPPPPPPPPPIPQEELLL